MPTLGLKHPPDGIAWEIPIPTQYLAVALLAVLVAVRTLLARRRTVRRPDPELPILEPKRQTTQFSLASVSEKDRQKLEADLGPGPGQQGFPISWARGFVPLRVVSNQLRPAGMDDSKGELGEDRYPWSALGASRGVSTNDPETPHDPSDTGRIPSTITGGPRRTCSPRASSRASSGTRHSGSSDGIAGQAPRDKGKGSMAGACSHGSSQPMALGEDAGVQVGSGQFHSGPFQDTPFSGTDLRVPRHFTRPPPPPPLTPPTLSGAFFPFEDRRPSYPTSIPPALDTGFIHQPNPEYGGSTSADVLSSSPQGATPFPRRRSYTRSIPIGIPVPTNTASASSSNETMTSGSTTNSFSPSSYPPTSPLLPPPPPGQYELPPLAPPEYEFVGGPGGPGIFLSQQEIDLQGEIISVMDGAGHGWKRHTRVYGGGACLACVAATQRDDEQGGFYGDKVPLADRR